VNGKEAAVVQPWRPNVRLAIGFAEPCRAGVRNLQPMVDDVVEHAAGRGVRLLDTADAYAPDDESFGLGEIVALRAVNRLRPSIRPTIMTKGGHTRTPGGGWSTDGGFEYLRSACYASLERLGQEALDLYTFHRPDPGVDFEESLAALQALVAEGAVRTVALSNVSEPQITRGRAVLGSALVAVQNELSVLNPTALPEVRACERWGLTFFAWSPLGGIGGRDRLAATVSRRVGGLGRHTAQQWALAWLVSVSRSIVPVVGVSRRESVDASLAALRLDMSAADCAALGIRQDWS
jgi:aryl-alcohol dehydrogenase-like predicted oxidoreductase